MTGAAALAVWLPSFVLRPDISEEDALLVAFSSRAVPARADEDEAAPPSSFTNFFS